MRFRREEINSFHATQFDVDPETGTLLLRYALEEESSSNQIVFEERIELGGKLRLEPAQERAFERLVRLIHAVGGTSYYKAAAPGFVSIDSGPLSVLERRFVADLYDKGLREFAFKNGLPVPLAVELLNKDSETEPPLERRGAANDDRNAADPPSGIGIPIGGGKDSIVVVEALRDLKPLLIGVNPSPATRRVAEVSGLELVTLTRTLDPALMELNDLGALNGHIPITALISLIAIAAGYVHGYSTTIMALEGSADEATRLVGGIEVNHQWSKSTECERELRDVLSGIAPGIGYGSALRSLSELEIGRCFSDLAPYHRIFRSCNRAFSLSNPLDGWCNDCPKCRFVYLTLATAMNREELVAIFGSDLLGSAEQVEGFRDLFDMERKPFECVGTRSESIAAFKELLVSPVWSSSVVVKEIGSLLPPDELPGESPEAESPNGSSIPGVGSGAGVLEIVRKAADSIRSGSEQPSAGMPANAPGDVAPDVAADVATNIAVTLADDAVTS